MFCNVNGHNLDNCRQLQRRENTGADFTSLREQWRRARATLRVSNQPALTAHPAFDTPSILTSDGSILSTEAAIDTSDVTPDIGTPVPFNVMPNPHEVNAAKANELDTTQFYDATGNINALGSNSLIMMFLGLLAMNADSLSVKILTDSGATHSIISEDAVRRMNIPIQQQT